MDALPLIYDIARGSPVDGPGLRTVVFFKGCPLRCRWCHNPESHRRSREVAYYPARCIRCGSCRERCPEDAVDLQLEHIIRRDQCTSCGICADVCDSLAMRKVGIAYTVDELLEILLRDRVFYETSGGGVTLSGGEPLLYLDYVGNLSRRLKIRGIHVAVQTCGHFDYQGFRRQVLPWVDLVLYDVKLIDSDQHKRLTGRNNSRILDNLRRLASEDKVGVIPRIPLVPGLTAVKENLLAIADCFRRLNLEDFRLLAYNPSGADKWKSLGRQSRDDLPRRPLSRDQASELTAMFRERLLGERA